MTRIILNLIAFSVTLLLCAGMEPTPSVSKPTLCIVGGTPSTKDIVTLIADSIRSRYNVISFNRPGFGGTDNSVMSEERLFQLAMQAGLRKGDYAVIGISGGGPMALLLASKFKLKHCGIISGMVSRQAFFKYADKAVTKGIMESALGDYKNFEAMAIQFPNVEEIVKQAGAGSKEIALKACYDEFNFILSENLFPESRQNKLNVDWWHGKNDVNVPIESVEMFLKNYPNANLRIIDNATHNIDANVYVSKLLLGWGSQR